MEEGSQSEQGRGHNSSRTVAIGSWQAATLSQMLILVIQITILAWFVVENELPNSVSEHLPAEAAFSSASLSFVVLTVAYVSTMFIFTLRGRRSPLFISAVVGALLLVVGPAGFLLGYAKPAVSDLLELPPFAALVVSNAIAYRNFPKETSESRRLSSLHVTLFLLVLLLWNEVVETVWYSIVLTSPTSLSEYLPHEEPVNGLFITEIGLASFVFVPLIYLTWRKRKGALIVSLVIAIIEGGITVTSIITKVFLPSYDDFLLLDTCILLAVFSAQAYRSRMKL